MMSKALSEEIRVLCRTTSTFGLSALMVTFAESALETPTSASAWRICRWRFEWSTVSKSTMPNLPSPAAARYMAMGDPSPPAPMHRTLVERIFFWPARPTSGRIRWRE